MVSPRNTKTTLQQDLTNLGIRDGMTLMVHSSLSKIGWTEGGANTVVSALLEIIGPSGTLVMPAASPQLTEQNTDLPPKEFFDQKTTPTTMGAIPEAFRSLPNTLRSNHPLVSVSAIGPRAEKITQEHALSFSEGQDTPFGKLYQYDAVTLLLGVGFNRCTILHYAESLCKNRRITESHLPMMEHSKPVWVKTLDMGIDNGTLFPIVGSNFVEKCAVETGRVGNAECFQFSTRALVDFAKPLFDELLDR